LGQQKHRLPVLGFTLKGKGPEKLAKKQSRVGAVVSLYFWGQGKNAAKKRMGKEDRNLLDQFLNSKKGKEKKKKVGRIKCGGQAVVQECGRERRNGFDRGNEKKKERGGGSECLANHSGGVRRTGTENIIRVDPVNVGRFTRVSLS